LDSIQWLEQQIIREAALELAFEGHRWGDLVRIARRMNKKETNSGYNFMFEENIKKKYDRAGVPAPNFTTDEKSWYLPFYE
jgi:SusD family.